MKLSSVFFLALFTVACGSYTPKAPKPITVYQKDVTQELSGNGWLTAYNAMPEGTADQQAAKVAQRNRLLYDFVWGIDRNYEKFEVEFYAGKASWDIAGDLVQIGLSGAGVLSSAERVKTVLAAAATMASGTKASIDDRWINNETRQVIVSEMQALRSTQLGVIQQGMAQPLAAYPLEAGIRDVQAYFTAGTVVSALQAISTNASSQAAQAKAALRH
jgi:hypothetical protein